MDVCGCRAHTELLWSPGASVKLMPLTRLRLPICSICSPRVHCRKNRTIICRALGWDRNMSLSSVALPLPATGCELCSSVESLRAEVCHASSEPSCSCVLSGLPATAVSLTDLVSIADLFYCFVLVCYNHRFLQLEVTNCRSLKNEIFMTAMQ